MFDPVSFCLIIAQQVLATLIVDFIYGKRKSASMREVESMVSTVLEERRQEVPKGDAAAVSRQVLNEIRHLADQDPDLEWGRFRTIRLAPPIEGDSDSVERRNQLLAERMRRLDALVTERRRSLGLPVAGPGDKFDIETVAIPDNRDYWRQRLRETQERIAEGRKNPPGQVESGE
jgi:hypothetical protein